MADQSPKEKAPAPQERASGSVENPIPPGEVQPGEMNELASTLGGPVDVFPGRQRKPAQSGE